MWDLRIGSVPSRMLGQTRFVQKSLTSSSYTSFEMDKKGSRPKRECKEKNRDFQNLPYSACMYHFDLLVDIVLELFGSGEMNFSALVGGFMENGFREAFFLNCASFCKEREKGEAEKRESQKSDEKG